MVRSHVDERGRITRNALSAYGYRVLLGLSALLLTPYLYRRLGPGGFGTWSVMFTLMMIAELVETGFSTGVIKLVSEFRGRGRRDAVEETIRFGVVLLGAMGVIAALAVAGVGRYLGALAANGQHAAFRHGLLVLAGGILIRYPCVAFIAALKGYQRFDLANATDALYVTGFSIGAVAAVESGLGVLGVAIAYACAAAASGLLARFLLARVERRLVLRPRRLRAEPARRLVDTSTFALLAESMIFIGQRMDVLVIAAIRNAAAAAPFAAALKLQSAVQALTLPFVRLLMPMTSELWAQGRRDEVVRRVTIATRVALQLTFPVALGIALFSHDIVRVWLGPQAPRVTAAIVVILVVVQISTLAAAPAETVLVGVGRVRWVGGLALVEGLANVALTIVLVSAYGAIGAAIGTLLTSAVLAPVKYPLVCRSLGCPTLRFVRDSLGVAVVSSLPAAAAMVAVYAAMSPGAARLLLGAVAGGTVAAAVGASQAGSRRLRGLLRGRAPRLDETAAVAFTQLGSDVPAGTG